MDQWAFAVIYINSGTNSDPKQSWLRFQSFNSREGKIRWEKAINTVRLFCFWLNYSTSQEAKGPAITLNTIKDDIKLMHETRQGKNNHSIPKLKAPNDLANIFLCVVVESHFLCLYSKQQWITVTSSIEAENVHTKLHLQVGEHYRVIGFIYTVFMLIQLLALWVTVIMFCFYAMTVPSTLHAHKSFPKVFIYNIIGLLLSRYVLLKSPR